MIATEESKDNNDTLAVPAGATANSPKKTDNHQMGGNDSFAKKSSSQSDDSDNSFKESKSKSDESRVSEKEASEILAAQKRVKRLNLFNEGSDKYATPRSLPYDSIDLNHSLPHVDNDSEDEIIRPIDRKHTDKGRAGLKSAHSSSGSNIIQNTIRKGKKKLTGKGSSSKDSRNKNSS